MHLLAASCSVGFKSLVGVGRRVGVPAAKSARSLIVAVSAIVVAGAALPVSAQCTGNESLGVSCRVGSSSNKLIAKVKNGQAGQRVQFCYDGGNCTTKFFNNRGKAKASWGGAADGPHFIVATLPCGQDLTEMNSCATQPLEVQFQHFGNLNGENFMALGSGMADPATGVTLMVWDIQGLNGCDPLAVVMPTQVRGAGAMVARRTNGGINLLDMGGHVDIEIVALELTSVAAVDVSGNMLTGVFQTNGNLHTPGLDGALDNTFEWNGRPRTGQFFSNQTWFFDPTNGAEYTGVQEGVTYYNDNMQDLPRKQEQHVQAQEVYAYDSLNRRIRAVRDTGEVQPAGQANRCHFWTATAPDENCAVCPVAGGATVCGAACASDNDCGGYSARFACAGGGTCKVSYNPSGCSPCP